MTPSSPSLTVSTISLSYDELVAAFRCVHASLEEGGLFFFDLNAEAGFRANWTGVFAFIEDDHLCAIRNSYKPETALASWEATLFRLDEGAWKRARLSR